MYRHKYLIAHGAEETLPKLATAAQQMGRSMTRRADPREDRRGEAA